MKITIGCDILKIERIKEKIYKSKSFLKLYTEEELKYCNYLNTNDKNIRYESLSGIFSAKEALIKAFSKLNIKTHLSDFEIIHKDKIPYINFLNEALNKKISSSDISISHDGGFVFTTAILVENI